MKKFFAFAIALVSMAAVMTSCNNDDAEFIEQSAPTGTTMENEKPQEKKDICLLVAVTPEQNNYYDDIYTIQTSGQTQIVKVSEMEPATQEQIEAFSQTKEMAQSFDEMEEQVELQYYSIKLAQVNSAHAAKVISRELEVKADHPTEEFNFMNAACLYFNGHIVDLNSKMDIRYFNGIYGNENDVRGFANVLNQYSK